MSDDLEKIPFEIQQAVDRICDLFEEELLRGNLPRVEPHLSGIPKEYRDILRTELEGLARDLGIGRHEGDKRVFGAYEILSVCGQGGMGIVFKAYQPKADRNVALKVIRRDVLNVRSKAEREKLFRRFETEAKSAGRLDHDNIVTLFDVGEVRGQPYYSMRYVAGESLASKLDQGAMNATQAAQIALQIAHAVHETHRHGVLHRDIKPSNVLLDHSTGRALLTDFGLARLRENESELTSTGMLLGSPPYMSPEQTRTNEGLTESTDVYGVGATLYHMLTGVPPFQAKTPIEIIDQINSEPVVAPQKKVANTPAELDTICLRCLEKSPLDRYPNAAQLAEKLEAFLGADSAQPSPTVVVEGPKRQYERRRLMGLVGGSVLLAAAAVALGIQNNWFGPPPPKPLPVFDLAADWSDLNNPNGPWSYNVARGDPLTRHLSDWDPLSNSVFAKAQPAWAREINGLGDNRALPMWFKSVGATQGGLTDLDIPAGRVAMHGSESESKRSSVSWVSQSVATVQIQGGVWLLRTDMQRNMNWSILLNSKLLTSGRLLHNESKTYSSAHPYSFAMGNGGSDALIQEVQIGDEITLEIFRDNSRFSDFVGVDLAIERVE